MLGTSALMVQTLLLERSSCFGDDALDFDFRMFKLEGVTDKSRSKNCSLLGGQVVVICILVAVGVSPQCRN